MIEKLDEKPSVGIDDLSFLAARITDILITLGHDVTNEGLLGTPMRTARTLLEHMRNTKENTLKNLISTLDTTFEDEPWLKNTTDMVCMLDIDFSSWCEHHMLPYWGKASLAYIPTGKVVGISKLIRLTRGAFQGLTIQERCTQNIADCLVEGLGASGVMVVTEAIHSCIRTRGVIGVSEKLKVSALRGLMKDSDKARHEALTLLLGA